MIIRILLIIRADVLLIKSKCKSFFFEGVLIKKIRNPKPVVIKKIKRIKRPLEASEAKEWTLVKIPDLTKNVPSMLKEKQSIDRKINEVANDDLDGLEECLRHLESMDSTELQDKAKEMIDDCSKDELKKILNLLIKIARKSFEND